MDTISSSLRFTFHAQFLAELEVLDDISAAEEPRTLPLTKYQDLVNVVLGEKSHSGVNVVFWGYTVKGLASHYFLHWCLGPLILG